MEAATLGWRDGKRYVWPLGLLVPTLPLIALGLVEATGSGAFWFVGPVLLFAVFPLVDLWVGKDARNPPEELRRVAGGGPLVPLVHVRVPAHPVRDAVVGFCLLEVVNYLEHYGLLRGRRDDGRYERTRPEHSWNSNNVASNVMLYHLQRHSDHHANPVRRHQALRHDDDAPQLPTGYAGMIVLAAIPPLWRRVMDPLLLAHYGGDVTRANISPRKRAKLLARRGGPR